MTFTPHGDSPFVVAHEELPSPHRAMTVKQAASVMGIGVNSLRAHLRKVGYDDEGRPLFFRCPGGRKKLIWPDQLPLIRATLPRPQQAVQTRGGRKANGSRASRSERLSALTKR